MIDIEYNKGELLFEDKERAGHCMDSKWSKSNFLLFNILSMLLTDEKNNVKEYEQMAKQFAGKTLQ